jgi:hypothetical protein
MKNIHLISTPKPSRLVKNSNENTLKLCIQTLPLDKEIGCIPQNIYITSDEEIKEGDWYLFKYQIIKCENPDLTKIPIVTKNYCKKIILTTDVDLDGVQKIDDEFLEWFVKNPSCEEVKIELKTKQLVKPYDVYNESVSYYKIIIPKEEPTEEAKQRAANYMRLKGALEPKQIKCYCGHTTYCDCSPLEEPKQETLEEAAENRFGTDMDSIRGSNVYDLNADLKKGFIEGAKWMQERMYSEEDMIKFAEFIATYPDKNKNVNGEILHAKSKYDGAERTIDLLQIWFEQFKKK